MKDRTDVSISASSGSFVNSLRRLQQDAVSIDPPQNSSCVRARGSLSGPAFFPEGLGLSASALKAGTIPTVMAIGHNFGCAEYRQSIETTGREDDKHTWRNLDSLLLQAGCRTDDCFRTNWFVGLLPGKKQVGKFLQAADPIYEAHCTRLLIEQIKLIRPKAIILLGPEVARRTYQIFPALHPWRAARRWADIDRSCIGHSPRNVFIPGAQISTNVAALLHPSLGAANQGRRMRNMIEPISEVDIVRAVLYPVHV